ncbi:MAG: helix-turn-helix domain-containing protein [Chloroflexota bacterium]
MSIILFIIGAGLWYVGSLRLGTFQAEGPRVRMAGFVLTLPLIITQSLWFMVNMITRGDENALGFVSFLELPILAVGIGVAYYMLTQEQSGTMVFPRPTQRPQDKRRQEDRSNEETTRPSDRTTQEPRQDRPRHPLEGQRDVFSPRSDRQQTGGDQPAEEQHKPEAAEPKPAPSPARRPASSRRNFPTVMTTAEAASYLNMTEQAVIDLIEQGKLTAARINYRYRISRSVLDDFIRQQEEQKGSAGAKE